MSDRSCSLNWADTLASRSALFCIDEMQVTDVADAMLLRQLFEGLLYAVFELDEVGGGRLTCIETGRYC